MDLYFQGMAWINKGWTLEFIAQARSFYERALALDPGNVDALVGLAWVDARIAAGFTTDDRPARLAAAEAVVVEALSLAPDHAQAHMCIGCIQIYTNRPAEGIAECEHALALDRNLAGAHGYIGLGKIISGRPEETERHIQEALRFSVRDSDAFAWTHLAGVAKFHLGEDEEAVAWFRRSIEINRNNSVTHFYLAAALAHLGRLDQARSAVRAGLSFNPTFTISRFRAGEASDNPTYLAQRRRVYEGMSKAGVPEQ
jgi:tetratricopeptide (TPR) repeat protein